MLAAFSYCSDLVLLAVFVAQWHCFSSIAVVFGSVLVVGVAVRDY